MKEIRAAIIGCGKIADQHTHQIQRIAGSRIVAVCDSEKLMADQLAERNRVEGSFGNVDQMLRESKPDVVHITTPPQSHFSLATKCMEAGSHVYIEKPFSLNLEEAHAVVAMAQNRNLRITAGHNVQYSPETLRMRELVRGGALGGPPVHIESVFTYSLGDASYVKALLGDEKHWVRALPGKLLQNVVSHGIAKIAEFLDGTEFKVLVYGFTSAMLKSVGEDDIVDELRVIISDHRNTTAYFTFTTQVGPPVQELRIFGSNGAVIVDNTHRTVVQLSRSNSDFKSYLNFALPPGKMALQYFRGMWTNVAAFLGAEFHMEAGMKNLIEALYTSIRSGGPPPIPYQEILTTAVVMDEIFRQLNSNGKTPLERSEDSRTPLAYSGGRS